jgi:ADP-ribose pyrophosphatase YjhB (NUDIX family)
VDYRANGYNSGMAYQPFSHCMYCGAAFPENAPWPRPCANCGNISFRNPVPVTVVLTPVTLPGARPGLIVIRRAIPPRIGELALPGGFIDYGETWQAAGARELFEETGVQIDPAEISVFDVYSAPDNTLIVFGLAQPRSADSLPPFSPNDESLERLILTEPGAMAFSSHTEMMRRYFQSAG